MDRTPAASPQHYYQIFYIYFEYIIIFVYGITIKEPTPRETLEKVISTVKNQEKISKNEFCEIQVL